MVFDLDFLHFVEFLGQILDLIFKSFNFFSKFYRVPFKKEIKKKEKGKRKRGGKERKREREKEKKRKREKERKRKREKEKKRKREKRKREKEKKEKKRKREMYSSGCTTTKDSAMVGFLETK